MKGSTAHSSSHDLSNGVADQLIREVSESIVLRSSSKRTARRRKVVEPKPEPVIAPPVTVAAPAPVAEKPKHAPSAEPKPVAEPVAPKKTAGPVIVEKVQTQGRQKLAILVFQEPSSTIGRYVSGIAPLLAKNSEVHVFSRLPFEIDSNVKVHPVGECVSDSYMGSVEQFTTRVKDSFASTFGANVSNVTLFANEWSAVPAMLAISASHGTDQLVAFHSFECQRSDLSSDMSRRIQQIEADGIRAARRVLVHNPAALTGAERTAPECKYKLLKIADSFDIAPFNTIKDAGEVKARIHVGPIDPMILYVGCMDYRHGPEVLIKAAPAILKNHPKARFVFVGDGPELWPIRVHSRYLLLDYATRVLGHMEGQPLFDLIQAADLIVVPSREKTSEWPILAAWAAKKPVLATHNTAMGLVEHEKNGVLIYAQENSCVWGAERFLFDENLRNNAGINGHKKLLERSGWSSAAQQVDDLITIKQAK